MKQPKDDLISRKAFVEQLETSANYWLGEHRPEYNAGLDMARVVANEFPSADNWTPVSEQLPPVGIETLVSGGDGINISCYGELGSYFGKRAKEMGWGDGQDEQPGTLNVTHWKPLPSPPQKESK